MSTLSRQAGPAVPGQVTAVRILIGIQAAFMFLGALGDVALGAQNNKVAAGVVFGVIQLVLGLTLVAAIVKLGGCEPWTRVAVIGFQALVVLVDVAVMVSTGRAFGVIDIIFAAVIVGLLLTSPARACFAKAERR